MSYKKVIDELAIHKARSKFFKFKIKTVIITYEYKLYTQKKLVKLKVKKIS
jgi:hypothetical protein